RGGRTCDREDRSLDDCAAPSGRSGDLVRVGAQGPGGPALDAPVCRDRRHRWHRVELASREPRGGWRPVNPPRQRTPLKGLFRYSMPYRGRLFWAVAGMVVYATGSAGLAYLVKPIFDSALPNQEGVAAIAWGIVFVYLLKGVGSYVSSYLMADV